PMALENGIVYEAQKSGTPAGYVTIVNSVNNNGWTALGKWQPVVTAKKAETPQPATPVDQRPVLHRGDSAPAATASPTPEPPASANTSPPAPEDTDRPVLRRRAPEKPEPEQLPSAKPTPTPEGTVPATGAAVFTPG